MFRKLCCLLCLWHPRIFSFTLLSYKGLWECSEDYGVKPWCRLWEKCCWVAPIPTHPSTHEQVHPEGKSPQCVGGSKTDSCTHISHDGHLRERPLHGFPLHIHRELIRCPSAGGQPGAFDQDTLQWDLNVAWALTCRESNFTPINMLCPGSPRTSWGLGKTAQKERFLCCAQPMVLMAGCAAPAPLSHREGAELCIRDADSTGVQLCQCPAHLLWRGCTECLPWVNYEHI